MTRHHFHSILFPPRVYQRLTLPFTKPFRSAQYCCHVVVLTHCCKRCRSAFGSTLSGGCNSALISSSPPFSPSSLVRSPSVSPLHLLLPATHPAPHRNTNTDSIQSWYLYVYFLHSLLVCSLAYSSLTHSFFSSSSSSSSKNGRAPPRLDERMVMLLVLQPMCWLY